MGRVKLTPGLLHPITVEPTGARVEVTVAGHVAFYPDRADITVGTDG